MKKNMKRAVCALLVMCFAFSAFVVYADESADSGSRIPTEDKWVQVYADDHDGMVLSDLRAGNDDNDAHRKDGKAPLNNLYDLTILGDKPGVDYPDFSAFETTGKKLTILGNHEPESTSKNIFNFSNASAAVKGVMQGAFTVIPQSYMEGLNEFTISWLNRVYKPKGGYVGLALFYDNAVEENGISYFNGFDNYTFVGYKGQHFNYYSAFSVYGGERTEFETADLITRHKNEASGKAANDSIYCKIHVTRGEYEVAGKVYTAKIVSYSDDQEVCTSYAMWKDAPVLMAYETTTADWSAQFTNLELTALVTREEQINELIAKDAPVTIAGTAVRYDGTDGLRIFTSLKKNDVLDAATAYESGILLIDEHAYTGTLTAETEGVLVRKDGTTATTAGLPENAEHVSFDLEAPDITGKGTYVACAYVKYELDGKTYCYYSDTQTVGCTVTAAKLIASYETRADKQDWEIAMLKALADMLAE